MYKTVALLSLAFWVTVSYAQVLKIGYINVDKIINSSTHYQQESIKLAEEFEPKKQELLDLFNHINLLQNKLQQNKTTLNEKDLTKQIEKIHKLEALFSKESDNWQKKLNEQKLLALDNIQTLIRNIINQIALEDNYDLILYQEVAFASDEIDISATVIDKMEALLK